GRPVQTTSKILTKIPFGLGDWVGAQIQKMIFGDLSKYGLRIRKEYPAVVLRETGKTPVIDIGTIQQIKAGNITVYPDIDRFTEEGVLFVDGRSAKFDAIILATGYTANILDIIPDLDISHLDQNQLPRQLEWSGKWKGLYTIGFNNYSLGGILGTVYDDSKKIVKTIAG
ncbi:MAG: NAD(P)/FAD-dependent oxidoreductase, partial [Bacteroidia bacterium]|nr:NAD(P)/FAD-dependent oxidoreductase [Bacteroidia bacterium]